MVGMWGVRSWEGKASYLSFFSINFRALWTVLKGEKIKFPVTPKERQEGDFLALVIPQITVIALTVAGIVYGSYRVFALGHSNELQSLVVNAAWGLNNILVMLPMIRAARWKPPEEERQLVEFETARAR
jgi:cellulose synthase (UDP-forming)